MPLSWYMTEEAGSADRGRVRGGDGSQSQRRGWRARWVPVPFRSLGDQVIRAASSVAANLSEGHGRTGRDRLHHWRIAYGSAKEVDTFLRMLVGAGVVDTPQTEVALELFDQVRP